MKERKCSMERKVYSRRVHVEEGSVVVRAYSRADVERICFAVEAVQEMGIAVTFGMLKAVAKCSKVRRRVASPGRFVGEVVRNVLRARFSLPRRKGFTLEG